jgi:hypothetical protein
MQATKPQKQKLWAACKARGLTNEDIRDLIYHATQSRTYRSSLMTSKEIDSLLQDVNGLGDTAANKMRKKIIAYARKLGWTQISGNGAKVDMEKVDKWCVHSGKFHKKLQEHTYKELCQLVSQFEKVYASYL